jgi:HSP20 family molecular chaperone IbpA
MADMHSQRRWDPIQELQRELGWLFENLDPNHSSRRANRYPPLNIYDAGDRYILSVQLPGLAPGTLI